MWLQAAFLPNITPTFFILVKMELLPPTEACKEVILCLNAANVDELQSVCTEEVQAMAEGVRPQAIASADKEDRNRYILQAAARFLLRQLCYYMVSKEDAALAALTAPVTPENAMGVADGEAVQLSDEAAQCVATAWASMGKDIVQTQRKLVVSQACAQGDRTTTNRLHCSTFIDMALGEAVEVAADDESGEVAATLQHAAQLDRFVPSAHITLPSGNTLTMDADKAYELFCELDAIQLKMDELFQDA